MKAKAEIAAMFTVTVITPFSTMFGAGATLWGCDQRQTDDRNRREVSNEKRCHRYLQPASLERCWRNRRKAVSYVTPEIAGEMELFPTTKDVDVLLTQAQPALPKSLIDQEQSGEGGLIREPLDAPVPGEPK